MGNLINEALSFEFEGYTIALACWNPGMGSTGCPARWNVSPIWASTNMSDHQIGDEVFEPSEDSFMLHETYPTCPGSSTDVETSSGWSIPTSATSYFLRE